MSIRAYITIFHCFCRLSSSPLVFEKRLIFTVCLVNLDNLGLETGFCLDALQKKMGEKHFWPSQAASMAVTVVQQS